MLGTDLRFRRLPPALNDVIPAVSVLIPARNEENSIEAAVRSVIESRGVKLEVIVLDDSSTDRTATIVREISEADSRIRVETAPPLPAGWCGKQAACRQLARLAKHDLFVFLDADVSSLARRIGPNGRMANKKETPILFRPSHVKKTGTPLEWLLIPQIHSLLLGFLPIQPGRWLWRRQAFAAGCGQLFMARRLAYEAIDGHAAVRESLQ